MLHHITQQKAPSSIRVEDHIIDAFASFRQWDPMDAGAPRKELHVVTKKKMLRCLLCLLTRICPSPVPVVVSAENMVFVSLVLLRDALQDVALPNYCFPELCRSMSFWNLHHFSPLGSRFVLHGYSQIMERPEPNCWATSKYRVISDLTR